VLGGDQEQHEVVLEEVVDRPPVDARRLHGDVRAAGGGQPRHQPPQLARAGAERLHLVAALRTSHGERRHAVKLPLWPSSPQLTG